MISIIKKIGFLSLLFLVACLTKNDIKNTTKKSTTTQVDFYLTKPDKSALFAKQKSCNVTTEKINQPTIEIFKEKTYQEMDGFGFTLTGGSALHINNMSAFERKKLLTELFDDSNNNIGISYLRLSVGASDLDPEVFSYNDLPKGETDVKLRNFSIKKDKEYLIPILKEILEINPKIKILSSPWSAPTWMKTNKKAKGGSLNPKYYDVYANYFIKYIKEMKNENITIDAITIQNEPLHPDNTPSMYMKASEQANFIKNNLGPAFKSANLTTKIIIYDHNADSTIYPITIMNDPDARKYIDGSAFHLYGGKIENLSLVHKAHPDKNLYFTEQWIGAPGNFPRELKWHTEQLIIGAARNWCKTILEWNLAANSKNEPHTNNGSCDKCLGAVTIDGDKVTRNPAYYIVAHASKFVRPGSVRIKSNMPDNLPNVAFKTPNKSIVIIVFNSSDTEKSFNIKNNNTVITAKLSSNSVGTFIWKN